mmetsp:Transcript_81114/g.225680  ORF Transcript_81114/g.225680 Transcript_81114/m.225680 type:complete len:90 (+) Transcript_81114:307-576(+)
MFRLPAQVAVIAVTETVARTGDAVAVTIAARRAARGAMGGLTVAKRGAVPAEALGGAVWKAQCEGVVADEAHEEAEGATAGVAAAERPA